jgi:hypothetical protein
VHARDVSSKDLAQVVIGQRNRLLEYFFARRGTGKAQCPVGRAEYEKFFLQTPIFTSGCSDCQLMLGPGLRCVSCALDTLGTRVTPLPS